jgi:hypothetical protein
LLIHKQAVLGFRTFSNVSMYYGLVIGGFMFGRVCQNPSPSSQPLRPAFLSLELGVQSCELQVLPCLSLCVRSGPTQLIVKYNFTESIREVGFGI